MPKERQRKIVQAMRKALQAQGFVAY